MSWRSSWRGRRGSRIRRPNPSLVRFEDGPSTFAIFDAFADDAGRKTHLAGPIAAALMANASELLSQPPKIEQVDVLAAKVST